MSKSFDELFNLVGEKSKKIKSNNPLLKHILNNNDKNDNRKLSDFTTKHFAINKNDYDFNLMIIPKTIPVKKENARHDLDFEMKSIYAVNIGINDDKSLCQLTLDRFDSQVDANYKFNEWEKFIQNNNSEVIINKVLNEVKSREK